MRLLDRYVFRQVFATCVGAIAFFTFILLTANVLRDMLTLLLTGQLTLLDALPLIGLLVPFVFVYTLPMGMLCGILLVLGRMSAESETVAMRAAGISLARIALPIYVLALVAGIGAFAINLYYTPIAITRQKQQMAEILRSDPLKILVPRTFVRDFRNVVVYVHDRRGGELRDVWIWELDKEQRVQRFIRAESGHVDLDITNNQMLVTLNRVMAEDFSPRDPEDFQDQPRTGFTETTQKSLSLDTLFGQNNFRRKIDWFTWAELVTEEARLEKAIATAATPELAKQLGRVRISMQEKLTTAFTVLSFALIAVPLGIKVSRRETSANLGVAVCLALGYYFLIMIVEALEKFPAVRPDLLLWLPNVIFIGVALLLHRRTEHA